LTIRNVARLVELSAVALWIGSCGSAKPTTPSPSHPLVGSWSGAIEDRNAGRGTLESTFGEVGPGFTIEGTWSATFGRRSDNNGGTLAVAVRVQPLQILFRCTPEGSGAMNAELAGDRLTGAYFAVGCKGLTNGTIEIQQRRLE
jgi:hypothetical protein